MRVNKNLNKKVWHMPTSSRQYVVNNDITYHPSREFENKFDKNEPVKIMFQQMMTQHVWLTTPETK